MCEQQCGNCTCETQNEPERWFDTETHTEHQSALCDLCRFDAVLGEESLRYVN